MSTTQVSESVPRNIVRDGALRNQLLLRRDRLQGAIPAARSAEPLVALLREVDSALERMQAGTFGICETCHDTIENHRLLADPLCRNCLDHLSPAEQRALERDLDLAYQVQRGLLPRPGFAPAGWRIAYQYEPLGAVSGDYCDLIVLDDGTGYFLLGDVMGKGVAASMLMSHLHAIFRSLTTATRQVHELVAKANRIFCEGTLSTFFATLVCGRLGADGQVEICNAGHCHPLHLHDGSVSRIESTGLPLGLFADAEYTSCRTTLAADDSLVVYSDGVSEASNVDGEQYGVERLAQVTRRHGMLSPDRLVTALLANWDGFRSSAPRTDDWTVMAVRRESRAS
ncbi:MAG TPA: SpoIIE family protein phosphatase [Gemmataceae bacterium]|nr:SpoIIE family protein phosphatase [Gemmataceae bacterium]